MTYITVILIHVGLVTYTMPLVSQEACSQALLDVHNAAPELSERAGGVEVWAQCKVTSEQTLSRSLRPVARPER
jgi:hypothetical protein